MPKLEFDILDMMAPLVAALIFAFIVFLISFTCINWYCITKKDDLTMFEKFGGRVNLRLGPHSMLQIKRGGYASTYAKIEADEERRRTLDQQSVRLLLGRGEKEGQEQQQAGGADQQQQQLDGPQGKQCSKGLPGGVEQKFL